MGKTTSRGIVKDAAVVLARWLFGGSSSDIETTITSFVRKEDMIKLVSTPRLMDLTRQRQDYFRNLNTTARLAATNKIGKCLKIVQVTTVRLGRVEYILFTKIMFSVFILGATSGHFRRHVFEAGVISPVLSCHETHTFNSRVVVSE